MSAPREKASVLQLVSEATTPDIERPAFRVYDHPMTTSTGQKLRAGVYWHGQRPGKGDAAPVPFDQWGCSPLHVEAITSSNGGQFGRLLRFRNTLGQWREWAMPMDVQLQVDQEAATQAQQQVLDLAQRFKRELVIPITPVAGQVGATPAGQVDGYAEGGLIRGPGSGTSDSILARLSNGEFVMRADAVKHYGSALLQRLNNRQLPRFADGGLVSNALVPSVPMAAQQVERTVEASRGPDLSDYGYLGLDLGGGQTHEVLVRKSTELNLRLLAMKFGGASRRGR